MFGAISPNSFDVFDIGANKTYFDTGKWTNSLFQGLKHKSALLAHVLDTMASSSKKAIAIPGMVLDALEKYDPLSLSSLSELVATYDLELLSMPYHVGSTRILSCEEFAYQVRLHNETVSRVLGKEAKIFYSPEQHLDPDHVRILGELGIPSVLGGHVSTIDMLTDDDLLQQQLGSLENSAFDITPAVTSISGSGFENAPFTSSSLQSHLIDELKAIYPHILSSGDRSLLDDWKILSSHPVLSSISPTMQGHSTSDYEQYVTIMNILNDMAHKIRSVSLSTQGMFVTAPEISESPSSLLASTSKRG